MAKTSIGQTVSSLSPPDYVVLGMVGLGAQSGYEIRQMVHQSIRYFWTISQAQIYPSIGRLEAAGLIRARSDPGNKRRPRTVQLTAAGHRVLRTWLTQDEPLPFELRDIAMVKLFFADALDPHEARSLLTDVRQRSEQRVALLRSIQPSATELAAHNGASYPHLTLLMGIAFHQAMIDVCTEFEHRDRPAERRAKEETVT